MKAWKRKLTVSLTSAKLGKQMSFGDNIETNKNSNLNISVKGYKYMSTLKDSCTIRISNLTYSEVMQIISGEYYTVEVKAGYESTGAQRIFKGGVLYISNSIDDTHTNTIIILCASDLVATYGQSRLNLTLNSGINVYSAIKFICDRSGIPTTNISEDLKTKFLQEITNVNDTAASWIDKLSTDLSLSTNSDSVTDSILSIFDASNNSQRIIDLTSDNIILTGGYPQLTTDGLSMSLMPTFSFMCGDTIKIDNSIIDLSVSSASDVSSNLGYYLDTNGYYVIYEIAYDLENRGSNFSMQILSRSKDLLENIT